MSKSKKALNILFIIGIVLLSGFIRSFGIHSFILPNHFAPGGITGISTMLQYATKINAGIFLLALNAPLIVIAFIFVGKRFGILTLACNTLTSGLLMLFGKFNFFSYTEVPLLAAVAGGLMCGISFALMLRIGGSPGGTEIIATIIQKKFSATNVAWFVFMMDSLVVFSSIFVYKNGITPALFSLVDMFASSKIAETLQIGVKSAIKIEIITDKPQELSKEILSRLKRGVTKIPAVGMYTNSEKSMLVCIVKKRQLSILYSIMKNYPDSFAFITTTSEVMGHF